MIRCYLGALLLALLLALGLISGKCLTDRREQVLFQAREALEAAGRQDWQQADRAADRARDLWRRSRGLNAVFSDHAGLDAVEDAFAVTEHSRDPADYSRLCVSLEILVREQSLSLENIF